MKSNKLFTVIKDGKKTKVKIPKKLKLEEKVFVKGKVIDLEHMARHIEEGSEKTRIEGQKLMEEYEKDYPEPMEADPSEYVGLVLGLDVLEQTFLHHAKEARTQNLVMCEQFHKDYPGQPLPVHFKEDFCLPEALALMCKEILALKERCGNPTTEDS